jgi:hypothetical protein
VVAAPLAIGVARAGQPPHDLDGGCHLRQPSVLGAGEKNIQARCMVDEATKAISAGMGTKYLRARRVRCDL